MEDGTVANGQAPPPPSTEESASQVDALVNDLITSKSIISNLEARVDAYNKERTVFLRKIEQLESKAKAMDSIIARTSSLEGDVARLQHDLVSAMSEGEEATAEADQLRIENSALGTKVGTLEEKLVKAEKALGEKDVDIGKAQGVAAREVEVLQSSLTELRVSEGKATADANQLRIENSALGKKAGTLEERVAVLDGRIAEIEAEKSKVLAEGEYSAKVLGDELRKAEKALGEKDGEIGKARGLAAQAISEVEVLQKNLTELRVSEGMADAGKEEKRAVEMSGVGGDHSNLLPYAVTAMSAGTIAAAATVCYLRLSREK